jgi:hypothetical protein
MCPDYSDNDFSASDEEPIQLGSRAYQFEPRNLAAAADTADAANRNRENAGGNKEKRLCMKSVYKI